VRAVTEGDVEDPDRLLAGPVVVVERAAEGLARDAELTGMAAIGVSQTAPQSSALPICCLLNSGVSEPSPGLLSTSTLDVAPLVSSVTCSR